MIIYIFHFFQNIKLKFNDYEVLEEINLLVLKH